MVGEKSRSHSNDRDFGEQTAEGGESACLQTVMAPEHRGNRQLLPLPIDAAANHRAETLGATKRHGSVPTLLKNLVTRVDLSGRSSASRRYSSRGMAPASSKTVPQNISVSAM